MSDWQRTVIGAVERVERRLDRLKRRLGSIGDVTIVPYRSYGSVDRLLIRGRVLSNGNVPKGKEDDSVWQNLLNTYRRVESDEVVGARIRASSGDAFADAVSDEEGYFRVWLPAAGAWPAGDWSHVSLQLCQPFVAPGDDRPAGAEVLVPAQDAHFGVISDIDDTVIKTYATELFRMARLILLGNARTRLPFPGVAAFYRALHAGRGVKNPIFYVSSSPWNLYDLLVDFLELQDIPPGPMFLRDWGISRDEMLPTSHTGHKLKAIEELFAFYAQRSFILIGDSGQHDPEIYAEIVRRYGKRVLAVYIRDVSPDDKRDDEVIALAREVSLAGSTLVLAGDTMAMAQHAAKNEWIEPTAIDEIARECHDSMDSADVTMDAGDEAI